MLALSGFGALACVESKPPVQSPPTSDTSRPIALIGEQGNTVQTVTSRWDPALGAFVGYGADSEIVVFLPGFADPGDTAYDASPANNSRVDLFGYEGLVGSAVIGGLGKAIDDEGCFGYSRGRVDAHGARWSAALPAGIATGLSMRSLDRLRGADSTILAQAIADLAAKAPGFWDALWKDQPVAFSDAVTFDVSGITVIAGSTTRMLKGPQHDARTVFVVGERAQSDTSGAFSLAYVHPAMPLGPNATDASGLDPEDEVGVAAAVMPHSNSQPTLLLETRGNEVNGYAALGRVAPGQWKIVWSGLHEGGC